MMREQVQLIPREKELKSEMLRKKKKKEKIYRHLCSLMKGTEKMSKSPPTIQKQDIPRKLFISRNVGKGKK